MATLSNVEKLFLPPQVVKDQRSTSSKPKSPVEEVKFRDTNLVLEILLELTDVVLLEEVLRPEHIEIAVRRAAAQHFRLCVGLEWDEAANVADKCKPFRKLGELCSELPINFRCFTCPEDDSSFLHSLIIEETNKKIPERNQNGESIPLWRATTFLFENKTREALKVGLILTVNHLLGDGLSMALAARSFALELDWIIGILKEKNGALNLSTRTFWDVPLHAKPPNYDRLPYSKVSFSSVLASSYMYFQGLWRKIRAYALGDKKLKRDLRKDTRAATLSIRYPVYEVGVFPDDCVGTNSCSFMELPSKSTLALRKVSRTHGTSVTGALLAASAIAYKYSLPVESKQEFYKFFSWCCTVSDRHYADEKSRNSFGNYSNMGIINQEWISIPNFLRGDQCALELEKFWSLSRRMLDVTRKQFVVASYATGLMFNLLNSMPLRWQDSLIRSLTKPDRERAFAVELTNLRNAFDLLFMEEKDQSLSIKHLRVTDALGALSCDSTGNSMDFTVIVVTNNNVLRGVVCADRSIISQEELDSFTSTLKDVLAHVAEQS